MRTYALLLPLNESFSFKDRREREWKNEFFPLDVKSFINNLKASVAKRNPREKRFFGSLLLKTITSSSATNQPTYGAWFFPCCCCQFACLAACLPASVVMLFADILLRRVRRSTRSFSWSSTNVTFVLVFTLISQEFFLFTIFLSMTNVWHANDPAIFLPH